MPSSQSHKATLMAGSGGPYSSFWPGTACMAGMGWLLIVRSGLWTCVYLPDAPVTSTWGLCSPFSSDQCVCPRAL